MDWLGNLLSGGVLGGLTGLLGSGITAITNYKTQKLKNEHELAMAKEDRESMKVEADLAVKKETVRVEGEVELAEMGALTESYKQDTKYFDQSYMDPLGKFLGGFVAFLFALVDFLKGLARPALTYYLVGASTWLTVLCYKAYEQAADAMLTEEMFVLLVQTIVYLTVSSVTWWFCDRRMAKFLMRLNDGNIKR